MLLLAAPVPYVGLIAHHCWFLITCGDALDRWEVWQKQNAGGRAWGHLHQNLLAPFADVGAGGVRQLAEFSGDDALRLASRIEASPLRYPKCQRYFLWPGPNSNTWVAWVLQNASVMGAKALGRGYARLLHEYSPDG